MREFDHIVSLGSFCQTTYQLKRLFPQYQSGIFDWWVTSTSGLVRLFEEDFKNIFNYDYLNIVDEYGKSAVMCGHYGIMHYHDFEKPEDRIFGEGLHPEGKIHPVLMRNAIPRNIQRVSYLYKRFCEMSGNVLLIRVADGHIMYYDQNGSWNESLIDRFFESLKKLAPNINPTLLLLNTDFATPHRPDVIFDIVDNKGCTEWYGSDEGWDELFNRIGFKLKERELPAAETQRKDLVFRLPIEDKSSR